MYIRRNLWRAAGAFAVLLPVGLIAALEGPNLTAGAAPPPSFPVACNLSGTVNFSPPLTLAGVVSGNSGAVTTTTITGGTLSNCLSAASAGAPSSGTIPTLTITTPATKLVGLKVNKVQQYATGYCPAFAGTATLKSLKGLSITANWTGGAGGTSTFTVSSPSPAINFFAEVGFNFLGKMGTGSYAQKALNEVTAFLDPTSSEALGSGCSGHQTVTSAIVDPVHSVAVL